MKYKELIQFDPITSVVKLVTAGELSIAEILVKTFVFSEKMQEDLREIIIKNLITEPSYETKGIQVVGSYGTGKSHLMSVVSAIAENADLVKLVQSEELKKSFKSIAGKYNVLRFEIGTDKPLKDIVFAQIERFLKKEGVDFKFDDDSHFSWKELIQQGVDSGQFSDTDVSLSVKGLMGVMNWTITWYRSTGKLSIEEVADNFTDLFLHGLEK